MRYFQSLGSSRRHLVVSLFFVVGAAVGLARTDPEVVPDSHGQLRHVSSTDRLDGAADNSTCATCHEFQAVLSHPVHVRPSMQVPSDLPLTAGFLTCETCHEVTAEHGTDRSGASTRTNPTGASLCVRCHQPSGLSGKGVHAAAIDHAHLRREVTIAGATSGFGLDAESMRCMSCHDGASATEAGSHVVKSMNSELNAEHPVGVAMRATERTRGGDFKLASPHQVDPRIRFFGGKLGCGSCHSMYSRERSSLVMSNRGSRLCLSCHRN